jgi:hypothetical protein
MNNKIRKYALIYIEGKKPIKKQYDSCMSAFYDYENLGCIKTELYNIKGILLAFYTKTL